MVVKAFGFNGLRTKKFLKSYFTACFLTPKVLFFTRFKGILVENDRKCGKKKKKEKKTREKKENKRPPKGGFVIVVSRCIATGYRRKSSKRRKNVKIERW